MQTSALVIHRYNGRYYIKHHRSGGEYQNLGVQLVSRIPTDPEAYQAWLGETRAHYSALEDSLEFNVCEIKPMHNVNMDMYEDLEALPSEIPSISEYKVQIAYLINLDREVFTVDFSMHWKLANIPRDDNRWLRAICDSVYAFQKTISYSLCSDEHMADVSIKLPEPIHETTYPSRVVTPHTQLTGAYSSFMTQLAAQVFVTYQDRYIYFAREWSPDSFPFRELTFALVSILSGDVRFTSFRCQSCNPAKCRDYLCPNVHFPKPCGFVGGKWISSNNKWLTFGDPSHVRAYSPGAAPQETMYWVGNVVVTLVLVPDGKAVSEAADWGISQGRNSFQIAAMSLFNVVLAEVYRVDTGSSADCNSKVNPRDKYFVRMTRSIPLSPLRERHCTSTHPRERPELGDRAISLPPQSLMMLRSSRCTSTLKNLTQSFPGLAALCNFFEVAALRSCSYRHQICLPTEIYDQIMEHVCFRTWRNCLTVSSELRAACLEKYRLNRVHRILRGPPATTEENQQKQGLSYLFENRKMPLKYTGTTLLPGDNGDEMFLDSNWMPIIGTGGRCVLMMNVNIQFIARSLDGQILNYVDDTAPYIRATGGDGDSDDDIILDNSYDVEDDDVLYELDKERYNMDQLLFEKEISRDDSDRKLDLR